MSKSGQALLNRPHNRNTDMLLAVARQHGFLDENLIAFEDNGINASTRIDEREGLHTLVAAIEREEIKTVFLLTEYSLWRDAAFIELCRQNHVYVVTLTQVYDFEDSIHVHVFRFALESESFSTYARTTIARCFNALRQTSAAIEEKE